MRNLGKEKSEGKPNSLIKEKSPYLLQHAYNPVQWLPWGEEAFSKAKQENKPIFLSIGYSSCHWCHVMEKESFEDPEIAKILNEYFIPIKVDREERPDIDELYMKAVQLIIGYGGWPLNVFLTPELKPFYGGTYFPPQRRFNLPSFKEVLESVAKAWKEEREKIINAADQILKVFQRFTYLQDSKELSFEPMNLAYEQMVLSFDKDFGGFGEAPKFPMPSYLLLLLRYWWLKKDKTAELMIKKTLTQMGLGGIYDQVGGGFHRYSTDRRWLIPHFEKMLYDNAQLLQVYSEAYSAFKEDFYKVIGLDIAHWILREMKAKEGGFYSAVDADSEGEEGKYYIWSEKEFEEIFGGYGKDVARFFGVTQWGNFEEGKNVLYRRNGLEELSSKLNMNTFEALKFVRQRLFEHREKRTKPFLDDKILVSWNALTISSLAYSGVIFQSREFIDSAKKAADFLLEKLLINEELRRYWREGPSETKGVLEDYSFLCNSLIDLWQYTANYKYLEAADSIAQILIQKFHNENGGFYTTPKDSLDLPVNLTDVSDGVIPSGNSMTINFLSKLYLITANENYLSLAEESVKKFWRNINISPSEHSYLISTLGFLLGNSTQLLGICTSEEDLDYVIKLYSKVYNPYLINIPIKDDVNYPLLSKLLKDKKVLNKKLTFYVCKSFGCKLPTNDFNDILMELSKPSYEG
ncbi:MAG: thioredoxin domain-containing protein [Nitrososphaerales archaeon]